MAAQAKQIITDSEARIKLREGIDAMADAVRSTLGPSGNTVLMHREYGGHYITKDGVSVAKDISFKDPVKNLGASVVKEVAVKTNDEVGDGTTTSIVLAQAIIKSAFEALAEGKDRGQIIKEIRKSSEEVISNLKKSSTSIENDLSAVKMIATVSANGDEYIGQMIADAIDKIGTDGVITVEKSNTYETHLEVVDGMKIDRGFISPYFQTDPEKGICEYEDCFVLVTDMVLNATKELLSILEFARNNGKALLLVAPTIEGELVQSLIMNKMQGILRITAMKAPGMGDEVKEYLQDIAVMTGATVVSSQMGVTWDRVNPAAVLGTAKKVTQKRDSTLILNDLKSTEALDSRVAELNRQLEEETNSFKKTILHERIAKLLNGIAVIYVGAESEIEQKELKDRIDDALSATRSALQGGYGPGGGAALIYASRSLDSDFMKTVCEAPLRCICENASFSQDDKVDTLRNSGSSTLVFNARIGDFQDALEGGVIDPTVVTVRALTNAVSIATTLISTNVIVFPDVEDEDPNLKN